jgi:uncharacterized protein YbjQ (UPF0145 family)
MWSVVLPYLPFLVLIVVGFAFGRMRERAHFNSLAQRERELANIPVINLRAVPNPETVTDATLLTGDVVIATDYFKGFLASFRNIIGGEVRSYETLMERARREALLRVLEQARSRGASELWNIRYETSNIRSGARRSPAVSVEVVAYGTAIVRRQP